jgi:MFS family permease
MLLAALIPERFTSSAARRVCAAALVLFPLALVGGFLLLLRNTPPLPVTVNTNREMAIALGRALLIREGLPAQSWTAFCSAGTDNSLLSFANARAGRTKLWSVAPPIVITCTFQTPGKGDQAQVTVSMDGRIVGFDRKRFPVAGPMIPEGEARKLAMAALPPGVRFGAPSVETSATMRTYVFHSSAIPNADVKVEAAVQGDRVVSLQAKAEPDDDAPSDRSETAQTVLTVFGGLFVSVVVLFSIYRYISRSLQQEISHKRSLTVALLCAVFCMVCASNAVVQSEGAAVPFAFILLGFAVLGVIGGGLVAAAYGSGEGDIREAFPGKLTSLDTLLSGHVFSRNIGVSVLSGMACGGWLVFALGVLTTPFRSNTPFATSSMAAPFIPFWWLMPLVTMPLISLCYAAAGLLQPLAFLHRYMAKAGRWHMTILVVCAGLVSTLRVHSPSTGGFVVSTAIFVLALLLPFFLSDLFAALLCVGVLFSAVEMAGNLAAFPAFIGPYMIVRAISGLGTAIFAVLCVLRGREWSEEEVRPLYARHIAERKSLEAEVSAAREAQLRLLPESVPEFAGLNISAACVPAETVGGDFYDFFPLGDGRLGVFIAEGNKAGLAAALTIALAKGYLMQCVERFHEPVEILSRLETALATMFERESVATDFAFVAIDTAAGEVRYARTNSYPKVVVVSASGAAATERMVPVKGRGSPIAEGRARITPGDHVVLFTDGIGRRLAVSNRKPEDAAASLVAGSQQNTPDEIRQKFFASTKASLDPDDLTVIVIRMQTAAANEGTAAWEVVA